MTPETYVLTGKRILIVEDEPIIALDLESAITDAGGSVLGPTAGAVEGLRLAQTHHVDGAIVDLRLGDYSAVEIVEWLHQRKIPCVIHTGQADRRHLRQWPQLPVFDKPVPPEVVLAALAERIADHN